MTAPAGPAPGQYDPDADIRLVAVPVSGLRAQLSSRSAGHTIDWPIGANPTLSEVRTRMRFDPTRTRPPGEEREERIRRRQLLIHDVLLPLRRPRDPLSGEPTETLEDYCTRAARAIAEALEAGA